MSILSIFHMKKSKAAAYHSLGGHVLSENELKKLQDVLLDMYKDLLKTCRKYRLTPFLCGGSALGAIRHKGFIPWDDDLDIAMTRKDFRKLCKVFWYELGNKYILNAPNYSTDAKARFPKIIKRGTVYQEIGSTEDPKLNGVFIDIFLIDNVPDNQFLFMLKGINANILEFISGCVYDHYYLGSDGAKIVKKTSIISYIIRNITGNVFSFLPPEKWFDITDKAVSFRKRGKRCALPTGSEHYFGEVFEKSDLFPAQHVEFCGIKAPVFNNARKYLRNLYGKYWLIPETAQRVTHSVKELKL